MKYLYYTLTSAIDQEYTAKIYIFSSIISNYIKKKKRFIMNKQEMVIN